ncbi:peptide ABC transporter substrate-binding protein [Sansalvadorimonas verongulae]|uniref:peptide ABC transporter substrate-binding protein n=1 Tax=Sansalvadorimonas verongulae TaxID=2172824 RepID=UPI0018AD1B3D|nr:peptide ABC transporter substrate-binding protein [Sansalvadorimonas verongulae]
MRGLPVKPVSLDPHRFLGSPEAAVLKDMFEGLTVQDEAGNPSPGAAESWSVSEDGRIWIFQVRQGLTWSDGSPLTAKDFLYSFQRLADPTTRAQYSWYLELAGVRNSHQVITGELPPSELGVHVLNAHTLVIVLDEPRSWLPALLTFPAFLPVSEQAIQRCGPLWAETEECAVTNGPYRFLVWNDDKILLERNLKFHRESMEAPEEVVWKVFGSILDEAMAFQQQDLDISSPIPVELGMWQKGDTDVQRRQLNTTYLVFNPQESRLTPELRQALADILDREAIYPGGDKADQAWTLIPPWTRGYHFQQPDAATVNQGIRDQQARALLAQAGIDEQNPVQLEFLTTHSNYSWPVRSIAVQWRRLPGVNVKVVTVGWEEYVHRINSGDYHILLGHWLAAYNDPSAFLLLGSRHFTLFPPGLMDENFEGELQKVMGLAEPDEKYQQLEQRLLECYSLVPLSHIQTSQWVQPYVKGFDMKNPEGWLPSYRLSIKDYP